MDIITFLSYYFTELVKINLSLIHVMDILHMSLQIAFSSERSFASATNKLGIRQELGHNPSTGTQLANMTHCQAISTEIKRCTVTQSAFWTQRFFSFEFERTENFGGRRRSSGSAWWHLTNDLAIEQKTSQLFWFGKTKQWWNEKNNLSI